MNGVRQLGVTVHEEHFDEMWFLQSKWNFWAKWWFKDVGLSIVEGLN